MEDSKEIKHILGQIGLAYVYREELKRHYKTVIDDNKRVCLKASIKQVGWVLHDLEKELKSIR